MKQYTVYKLDIEYSLNFLFSTASDLSLSTLSSACIKLLIVSIKQV